jgi:hypothetical protein
MILGFLVIENLEAILIQGEEAACGAEEYSRRVEINPQRLGGGGESVGRD